MFANIFFLPCYLGRQELYAKRQREKYTGDVPMYSSLYISSESIIGVNLWPKDEPMYIFLCCQPPFLNLYLLKIAMKNKPR